MIMWICGSLREGQKIKGGYGGGKRLKHTNIQAEFKKKKLLKVQCVLKMYQSLSPFLKVNL